MPKVTIIVSVHNPGKYLTPCLNSIVNQTFQDIEILLIDDGSTDGSRQILKDYEKENISNDRNHVYDDDASMYDWV